VYSQREEVNRMPAKAKKKPAAKKK